MSSQEKYSIKDLLNYIDVNYEIVGEIKNKFFSNIKPVFEADKNSLVWINPTREDKLQLVGHTKAEIILCDPSIEISFELRKKKCFIIIENPRLVFSRVANGIFKEKLKYGVHPTAYIHPDAKIHKKSYIGAFNYIGKCEIGEGSILYGHIYIYDNVKIGRNVIIHAGSIIGADGFGYSKNESEELEKFPHFGGVVIEDSVEIGANTCVDRGTLSNTILKKGAKIDNLVHIAHNVVIGIHSVVIAQAMIGGSTVIGDYSWIAPSAVLRDGIKIGNKTTVGMGAVVTKNIPNGEVWTGVPAIPLEKFKKLQESFKFFV